MATYGAMARKTYAQLMPPGAMGFDLDGVLAATMVKLREQLVHEGYEVPWNPQPPSYWTLRMGMTPTAVEASILTLNDEAFYREVEPVPGALETFERFRQAGIPIVIITARPPHLAEATIAWLIRHELEPNVVVFEMDKPQAVRAHRVRAMVEDAAHHLVDLAETGIRLYRPDYPYNAGAPGTPYTDLSEVFEKEMAHWTPQTAAA